MTLEFLLRAGGAIQIAILVAGTLVPQVLDWKNTLQKLDVFMRKLIWVYGLFIFFTIIGFGLLTILFAESLAAGTPLARAICALIGTFWLARLGVQLFVFDIRPLKLNAFLRVGYHGLTAAFAYLAFVYGYAALAL